MKKNFYLFLTVLSVLSCSETQENKRIKDKQNTVSQSMSFSTLPAEQTGIHFTNTITETENLNYFVFEYMYNGGGVAVGDINNDGLTDIYFTGNQVSDKLYLNKGDMQFEDITNDAIGELASEGWHTGVSMVDVNQDGWLDIYVCRSGISENKDLLANLLFINNKNNTFTEKGEEYGVNIKRKTTQATFFDYDNDGDLDLYVMNHPLKDKTGKKMSVGHIQDMIKTNSSPDGDVMLENQNGKFIDVTKKVGMSNHAYGLGCTASDINNDGYIDLYVSNDYMAPDHLYINNGDGTFTDEILEQMKHISNFAMGNDIADFNNDGFLDIFTVDMVSEDHVRSKKNMGGMSTKRFWEVVQVGYHYQYMFNTLQMNNGNGTFSEIAQLAGVSKTDWSWAPLFVDFDNDGLKDLYITNGFRRDTRDNDYIRQTNGGKKEMEYDKKLQLMPSNKIVNYIYKNSGELHFNKKMEEWNLKTPVNSNGAAYADFDNDGDVDLVINNMDETSSILQNNLISTNNYIRINLTKKNTTATGSKVKIHLKNGQVQYQELQTVRGYQSSVEPILHFGLGEQEIDKVEIIWSSGEQTILKEIKSNQLLNVEYNEVEKQKYVNQAPQEVLFEKVKDQFNFKHQEEFVNDFEKEVLLPNKMSQLGPFMSSGDVNGDGLEDIYISGSKGFSGELFIQNTDGSFLMKKGPWNQQKQREEMDSEFFDIDNDGDLDLYVVSGGNEYEIRSKNLYDQLYINDGKGNFTNASNQLPFMETSGQGIAVGDYDKDGDLDVFIGGRQTPGYYPFAPRSFLLENQNGQLIDVTNNSKDIMGPGLITQSVFDDFDQDGDLDLICVGEWMPVAFFENNNGVFTNVTSKFGFQNQVGWWMSITVGDFNNDGKNDYIVGNVGENNKFHPSATYPLEIYCHDFDQSGTYDIVLGKYQNNVCYPVRGKQCSTEQMPFVSKKFPTYDEFAVADLEKIYGKENLEQALHYSATNFSSVILLSTPSGFEIKKLPVYAQISPINSGLALDVNKDGHLDFIGVGNNYAAEVETIRYDAGVGVVMLGDGKGNFNLLRPYQSGFFSNNDDKDLIKINKQIFISSNNTYVKQFKILK